MTTRGMHCVAYKETRAGSRCARFAGGYGNRSHRGYGYRSGYSIRIKEKYAKEERKKKRESGYPKISKPQRRKHEEEMKKYQKALKKKHEEEAKKMTKAKKLKMAITKHKKYGYMTEEPVRPTGWL